VSPAMSAVVGEAAAEVGVPYLRSPVSGSTVLVASGALSVLASGPREAFDAFAPVFEVLARRTFFLGPGEEARVMKLALNTLVGITVVGLSEALVFGERCGLSWAAMLEVFADSAVSSPLVKYKATTLLERDFEAAFTTQMMAKDLDVALGLGRRHGAVMPTTALTQELLRATGGSGWADKDFSASVLLFEQLSGLPVSGP
jgi:3-hydroxyisobutyrate dehydrogenase-like beta-hydroxyacid dehydrogenase